MDLNRVAVKIPVWIMGLQDRDSAGPGPQDARLTTASSVPSPSVSPCPWQQLVPAADTSTQATAPRVPAGSAA